jgi:Acetyltransferase (GNAT) domain
LTVWVERLLNKKKGADRMVELKTRQDSMIVRVISPTDSHWQNLLETIPHDFYHLPGYLNLEATKSNAVPEAIIIKDDEKVFFLPYLIRDCSDLLAVDAGDIDRIYDIISPYGYPGLLVNQAGQNPGFIKTCLNLIYNYWHERNICSAFIRLHPILNSSLDSSFLDDQKFILCQQGDVVTCDLTKNFDDIWKQFRPNHRTKINKLARTGFVTKIGSVDQYLDVFIDIYRETMDRVNATDSYYFTHDYFTNISQILADQMKVCVVEIDSQVVAASLVTEFSGIIQYYLGGTRTEFLRYSPATMMFKQIIEWAQQRNNICLNLGGGLGGSRDSLYHFKAGFSDESTPFTTIRTIVNRGAYNRLVSARAKSLGVPELEMESLSFFPAYRSS